MGAYQLGTGVTITEHVSVLGVLADPTLSVFHIEAPDGTVVDYTMGVDPEVTNPAVGVYVLELTPAQVGFAGQWHYNFVGTGAVEVTSEGDFFILGSNVDPSAPLTPQLGPCETWCDSQDVMAFAGNPASVDLTRYAVEASMLLYELSGRQFTGTCRRVVRPCALDNCAAWLTWNDASGQPFWLGAAWGWGGGPSWYAPANLWCGCSPLSRVRLSGYPVWGIEEVKIGGQVVSPETYRLDEWEYLSRVRADSTDAELQWPGCQNMDLPGTEPGTFQVTYLCGVSPPPLGARAAAQLAGQLYFAVPGNGECQLPQGATRVTRQGVTIERQLFASWGKSPSGAWSTGLTLVDAFLNGYNPNGLGRRPALYSPDLQPFARQVGSIPGGS